MAGVKVDVDAEEVGFDAQRLARIDEHFKTYVDDGRLPGWLVLVSRAGKIAHLSTYGKRDEEAGLPVEEDSLFRVYSMTKPITSVAAMMLYEEGAFQLTDPVSKFIPSFANLRVFRGGTSNKPVLVPAVEPVRIWHLLTHTSGLTYGFHYAHPVDAIYRSAGFEFGTRRGLDLEQTCDAWAELPLQFQPGTEWNYSVSTDVLGRVVEVASGMTLDRFFAERIFEPLGMTDTAFHVDESEHERLGALYALPAGSTQRVRHDAMGNNALSRPEFLSGGGGLVSTAADYHRFVQMLLGGGELDGTRLLGSRTVAYMSRNHLPGGVDIETFGRPINAETGSAGIGFGLGFGVVDDPAAVKGLCSRGEYHWGGLASTAFWVDPSEEITVVFLTQLMPSSAYPIRPELRQLVYQALVD